MEWMSSPQPRGRSTSREILARVKPVTSAQLNIFEEQDFRDAMLAGALDTNKATITHPKPISSNENVRFANSWDKEDIKSRETKDRKDAADDKKRPLQLKNVTMVQALTGASPPEH